MKINFTYILFFIILSSLAFSQNVDSLKLSLKAATKMDTTRLNLLVHLSESCEPAEIFSYAKPAIKLADELLNKIPEPLAQIKKSLLHKKASAINNMAYQYTSLGDVKTALEYYDTGLKIQKQINDQYGIASSLNDMGFIYNTQSDLKNALIFFKESLKIREKIKDNPGIAQSLINIGTIYINQKDYKTAFENYTKSLKIYEALNNQIGIAQALNMIGLIYKRSDNSKALECYVRSLKILTDIGYEEGKANCFNNMGAIYLNLNNYKLAKSCTDSSLRISKALGLPDNIKNAEQALYKIDSVTGDYTGAYLHYKNFIILKDSLTNEKTRKAIIKSQLNYEFEKKEAVIKEKQEKERLVTKEKNHFQQIIIYSVVLGFILVIIFALFIFRALKTTRHQKNIIEEKQKEILDSIKYAKRIQTSLLPTEKYIARNLEQINY